MSQPFLLNSELWVASFVSNLPHHHRRDISLQEMKYIVGKLARIEINAIDILMNFKVEVDYNLIFLIGFYLIVNDFRQNKHKWEDLHYNMPHMCDWHSFMKRKFEQSFTPEKHPGLY